jgi:hypothetical protein
VRPLEILLVVANLAALTVLVVPLRGGARWARRGALLPLLVAVVQLLVEGHAGSWSRRMRWAGCSSWSGC